MKNLNAFGLLTMTLFILISCQPESIDLNDLQGDAKLESESSHMFSSRSAKGSVVGIEENPDGGAGPFILVPGASSRLQRHKNGINVKFKTQHLIPGNAYTLWFVIFGDEPGPPILVTHAAGRIIGDTGKGNFTGHLSTNDIFKNPLTAEVHLALRTHGPAQPGMIPEQIQTLEGGCTSGFPSGPALHPDSDIIGYCANIQVAMHPSN